MNGIDTAIASALTSRVDSLLGIQPGSAATSQTGAAGVGNPPTTATPVATPAPQPSAQTALSAVALTLDAIARSGGEVTLAVLGQTPIWPAAPALDVEVDGLPLFDTPPAAAQSSASGAEAAPAAGATASVAAAQLPVAALASALEQIVGGSGLFYESHLAQWLSGQRSPDGLADEPQNRLVAEAAQLPLDWTSDDADASAANGTPRQGMGAAGNGSSGGPPNGAPEANANTARTNQSILTVQAARFAAGEVLANSLSDLNNQTPHASLHNATAPTTEDSASPGSQQAAAVHAATVPLVRQQLDLLATGQFRWTGEAWPGARLDWTIEQDGDEWDRSGGGTASEDDQPWRTRLTLSLPTLGTVDAELTLTGSRLVARVQASPGGAARLAMQGESFRQRLAAAGIELNGLLIREIGGGVPGGASATSSAGAQAAASAYARSASAAAASSAAAGAAVSSGAGAAHRGDAASRNDFDWDI